MRPAVILAAALALVVLAAPAAPAAPDGTMKPRLVRTIKDGQLGVVLATASRRAIYVWNREPRGKVRCTGSCAAAWPPVLVARKAVVPARVKGIKGKFGTIRRPDGKRQLTLNRRPLYTYAHERPGQVLCNDVDGWFAIKIR